jgi:hypothetical protein
MAASLSAIPQDGAQCFEGGYVLGHPPHNLTLHIRHAGHNNGPSRPQHQGTCPSSDQPVPPRLRRLISRR